MRVALLAGGTGAAKLAVGLAAALEPGRLSVITNTADDLDHWGLRICPDTDSVLFRLAGIFNEGAGYGVAGESFAMLGQMEALGEPAWFRLGDRDLAFHVLRTRLLGEGATLTEATAELARRLHLATRVLPMSDGRVRTYFRTEAGRLSFQEYFVRERLRPPLLGIEIEGLDTAPAAPAAAAALAAADLVLIGPSNPLISIAPITGLLGPGLVAGRTVAVSPIVGGRALKGPTVEMMRAVLGEATVARVAEEYRTLAGGFVIDERDAGARPAVEALGQRVLVTDTVMTGPDGARRLAETILAWAMS